MKADLNAARQYAFDRLTRELKPHHSYHNLEHTFDDVLPNALRLADLAGLNDEQKLLLATAAAYHDIGYPIQADGHEAIGAQIAGDTLPRFGYSAENIATIQAMICATALPQSPTTLSEKLLCDADLDLLGREDDFLRRNHDLWNELQTDSKPIPMLDWYKSQRQFVRSHRYHSAVARQSRYVGKQRVIVLLSQRILDLYRSCQDRQGEAIALNQLAEALAALGHMTRAQQVADQASKLYEQLGLQR